MRRVYSDGVTLVSARLGWTGSDLCRALAHEMRAQLPSSPPQSPPPSPPCSEAATSSDGLAAALAASLREKEALLMLDFGAAPELLEDPVTGGLLHTLLSCTLHLRILVGTPVPLPLPLTSRLPAKVVSVPLAPLSPIEAARLLARRVGRPLQVRRPRNSGGARGVRSSPCLRLSRECPFVPPPQDLCALGASASLEALAADPAVQRLRGHPTVIIAAAAAIGARPPQLSIREALVGLASVLN